MTPVYLFGCLLLAFGLAEAEPLFRDNEPAIIEDLRSASNRIVAGWPAVDGQIPHQINMRMVNVEGGVTSCGGSVISNNWVLTAAHCVANRITFVTRFGLTNLTRPGLILESERKHIHPNYNEIQAGVQPDDIALVGFDQDIPYGPFIQPCRLQPSVLKDTNYAGVRLTASGYGRTDDPWNGGTTSEILLWVYLSGISNEECLQWYNNSPNVQPSTVCSAYYNVTAQSTCQGDSGGPLTVEDVDGLPTMIGVVSFGARAGCNSPFPSAYIRPGYYHDWYTQITGENFDWNPEDIILRA